MWSKFDVGMFGAPNKVPGLSPPMRANVSLPSRVTMFGPFTPGNPAEKIARKRPPLPYYGKLPRMPDPTPGGYDSSGINPGGGPLPVFNTPILKNTPDSSPVPYFPFSYV